MEGRQAGTWPQRRRLHVHRRYALVAAIGGSPFCAQTIASPVPGIAAGCFDRSLSVADPIARGSRRTRHTLSLSSASSVDIGSARTTCRPRAGSASRKVPELLREAALKKLHEHLYSD